jgi:hypothetical protein
MRVNIDVCEHGATMAASLSGSPVMLPMLDCAPLLSGASLDEQPATRLAALPFFLADWRGSWVDDRTVPGGLADIREALSDASQDWIAALNEAQV